MAEETNILKNLSINFIICCYFGQSEDLIKAAIDRAYIDMASHTLIWPDGKTTNSKWECRKDASDEIRQHLRSYPGGSDSFDDWYKDTICAIEKPYEKQGVTLSAGQTHKWLNMTIKYIYVFSNILESDDSRLNDVESFLRGTCEKDYQAPIDRNVLKETGLDKCFSPWSKLKPDEYAELQKTLKSENDFLWELTNWESFAEKYKEVDKQSYEYYLKHIAGS